MKHLKTYEGLFSRKKALSFLLNDEVKTSFLELVDLGYSVDVVSPSNNRKIIEIHKGSPKGGLGDYYNQIGKFNIDVELEDILFPAISYTKEHYNISLKSIIFQYMWNPTEEAMGHDKLKIKNEKDWNKKLKDDGEFNSKSRDVFGITLIFK